MTDILISDVARVTVVRADGTVIKESGFTTPAFGLGGDLSYTSPLLTRFFRMSTFSDYSAHVLKWPKLQSDWDEARPRNLTISCANEDRTFNFFRYNKASLNSPVDIGLRYERTWSLFVTSNSFVAAPKIDTWNDHLVRSFSMFVSLEEGHDDGHDYSLIRTADIPTQEGACELLKRNDGDLVFRSRTSDGVWGSRSADVNSYSMGAQTFHHLIGAVDGNHIAIWVDGLLVGSSTTAGIKVDTSSDTAFYIGGGDTTNHFKCADFRVYTTSMDQFNAATLAQGRANIGGLKRPISWLDLQGSLIDRSDRGLHGAWVGDAYYAMGPQGLETAEFTVFRGRVTEAQFTDGECAIEVVDKFHQLYESIFGSDDQPIRLTAYFPSSLAFNLIGSAGLSSVPSSHNPDIDYESFTSWDTTFRDAITRMSTNYTGQRPTEILKEISQLTNSAIYIDHGVENSKIKFGKLSIADDSKINFVNDEDLISAKVRVSLDDVVNRQVIFADYSVNSNFHRVTVNDRSLASYSLYGKHEQIEKSNLVWFVNSTSAISAAQEIVLQSKDPPLYVDAKLPLTGLKYSISEKINIADSITNVADNFHIIGKKVDLDAGTVTITGRQTRVQSIFTLDFSKLDGSDILN